MAALLLLLWRAPAISASLSVTPSGNGTFSLMGNSMDDVSGIQADIAYDAASMSIPTVTQGGLAAGAMFAANTSRPGLIKIAVVTARSFAGSGQIAVITFAKGTGKPTLAAQSLINSKGAPIDAETVSDSVFAKSPLISLPQNPASTSSTSSATSTTSAAKVPVSLGSVTMPLEVQAKNEVKPADTTAVPPQYNEAPPAKTVEPPVSAPASEKQTDEKIKTASYRGIIEDFRDYQGEKTPDKLVKLFDRVITPTIRQEPAIVLSDGKTPVKIRVKLEENGDKSPNFALKGARMVSLGSDEPLIWIVEALPQTAVTRGYLTILTDSDVIEYPLTLAPPVADISPTAENFATFLRDSGATPAKHDLNNDGVHDYLDDFIYAANFMILRSAAVKTGK